MLISPKIGFIGTNDYWNMDCELLLDTKFLFHLLALFEIGQPFSNHYVSIQITLAPSKSNPLEALPI